MPTTLKRYLRFTSWPIIGAMIALMIIGVMGVRVCEQADADLAGKADRQTIYACVALAVFVVMTVLPYQRIGRAAYLLIVLTLAALVGVFFLPDVRGSHRWIDLGIVRVQPSEFAKLTYILMLAWYLRYRDNFRRLTGLAVPFVLTLLPMGLVFVEPDLGTSLLFLPTLYFMLFLAGAKLRHLLGIIVVATALMFVPAPRRITSSMDASEIADRKALAYGTVEAGGDTYVIAAAPLAVMAEHQLSRITGWLRQEDQKVARDKGYQLQMSKMVMGAGRWRGLAGRDLETYFHLLPDSHTDFIFSVIGGQWGLAGNLAVFALYAIIFLFGLEIASSTYDPFGRLLAVGVVGLLFSQLMINVGMTMGLMPITGMTLPLVSYGGSSLVMNGAALGMLINVGQRRPILVGPHPFEHGRERPKQPAAMRAFAQDGKP